MIYNMRLNVYKIIEKTKAEGPGTRFCIWVQGCSKHCKGCFAKSTWAHVDNIIMPTSDIIRQIKNTQGIEGITFLGGEPFEQASALADIAKHIKRLGLSIVTFTGLNYEDLKQSTDKNIQDLLAHTDLLIDGGYEEDKFDLSRAWVGSSNQRYIFLTNRYSIDDIKKSRNKIEIRIDKNGFAEMNGMADFYKLKKDFKNTNRKIGV